MESQPPNHEFRNNPENFYPCINCYYITCCMENSVDLHCFQKSTFLVSN